MFQNLSSRILFLVLLSFSFPAVAQESPEAIVEGLEVPTETFKLKNGLTVVLHEDSSDPIAAVAVVYHVGSGREVAGKTGFAHLFEHIMFQESEHVPQDQFFRKIREAGGTLNGGTWQDGTIYFEVVPENALEMALWMEADRMGWLLGALDEEAFYNQQKVVINEKKQRYDNSPYGYREVLLGRMLYPEGHPYNWQTIGSAVDVANATLDDVKAFFKRWYGPNNATLVIAGDINVEQTRQWVKKYFGEIPAGPKPEPVKAQPVKLKESLSGYYEDQFATVPEVTVVWPTVEEFNSDQAALDLLADVLGEGKSAILYKKLVEEKKLASRVTVYHDTGERAGKLVIQVNAAAGQSLTPILEAVDEALAEFDPAKVSDTRLGRIKAQAEISFYRRISSVFMKSMVLGMYAVFEGDPNFIQKDLLRTLKVQRPDIERVYKAYIKGHPRVILSMVPKGKSELAVAGAALLTLPDEANVEPRKPAEKGPEPTPTPSSFDRSKEPPKGTLPTLEIPTPEQHVFDNGLRLTSGEQRELPLVNFTIEITGGHRVDPMKLSGLAYMTAQMLKEGTKNRTPEQLEEALDLLGAQVSVSAGAESVWIEGSTLSRNFDDVMVIISEMLLEPRFAPEDFETVKRRALDNLNEMAANQDWIAQVVLQRVMFGANHIWGTSSRGTPTTVKAITLDDVKQFYKTWLVPGLADAVVVGDVSRLESIEFLGRLADEWKGVTPAIPDMPSPTTPASPELFVVDFPGASQSKLRVGTWGPKAADDDYYPATVMNFPLGGDFGSKLNLILREEKGYTYGASSSVNGGRFSGTIVASTSVQVGATGESLGIIKEQMEGHSTPLPGPFLEFVRGAMQNSMLRGFETLEQLSELFRSMAVYRLPADFMEKRQNYLKSFTAEDLAALAKKVLNTQQMFYLVVGDKNSVLPQLAPLKLGPATILNRWGEPQEAAKPEK